MKVKFNTNTNKRQFDNTPSGHVEYPMYLVYNIDQIHKVFNEHKKFCVAYKYDRIEYMSLTNNDFIYYQYY
jgi:hypothetical protein